MDMYASPANRKLEAFCSKTVHPGSRGDALAVEWPAGAYAFPPFSQLPQAMIAWRRSPGAERLLLVAPDVPNLDIFLKGANIVRRRGLLDIHLVGIDGKAARKPCPVPLVALLIERVPATGSAGASLPAQPEPRRHGP